MQRVDCILQTLDKNTVVMIMSNIKGNLQIQIYNKGGLRKLLDVAN